MKGLILSGGKGIRLRPLTYTSAKQLIPIANRPVIFYAIETLAAAGIDDIGIVVGDKAAEIQRAVGDGARFGVAITYIHQDAPRGLAHAVEIAQPFIGEQDFVVYLGDNLMHRGITPIVDQFIAERPDALLSLAHVAEPQRFGIAEFDNGELVRLVEKPVTTTSDLAVVGVYAFRSSIFDAIAHIDYSARGELEITDAIQRLIDDDGRRVATHVIAGSVAACAELWKDAGSLDEVLAANRQALAELGARLDAVVDPSVRLEGSVVIERGAILHDCVVRGPAIIGANAVLDHACIGPYTSVAADCVVRCADVENSILLQGSVLDNIPGRITASLIGKHCAVRGSSNGAREHTLLLGDHADIALS